MRSAAMFFFIPVGTTRPRWRVPYVAYSLLAANCLVYVLQVALGDAMPRGFVPAHPSPFTWLAAMFMHGDALHLLGNMLFLWLFGTVTEDVLGPRRFLIFYFAGNMGATALHIIMGGMYTPDALGVPVVGASGAIAGIMGLSAVCFLRMNVRVWYVLGLLLYWRAGAANVPAPLFLGLWFLWELLEGMLLTSVQAQVGFCGGIAHWAHVGGFAIGLGGALALGLRKEVIRTDLVESRRSIEDSYDAYAQSGDLEQFVVQHPEDADAWYALGRARDLTGRPEPAREAYQNALALFLREGRSREAFEVCEALGPGGGVLPDAVPEALLLQFAGMLEDGGRMPEAFALLERLSASVGNEQAEMALIRAAEMARTHPELQADPREFYRRLLDQHPYSSWRGLALERMRDLDAQPPLHHDTPEATHGTPAQGAERTTSVVGHGARDSSRGQ